MDRRVGVILGAGAVVMLAAGIGWLALRNPPPQDVKLEFKEVPVSSAPRPPASPPASPPSAVTPPPKAAPEPPRSASSAPSASSTGTLLIKSDVPDTSVFIDRVYLGTAPVTAKDLTSGTHHLNMSATGYDGVSEDIDVAAGTHELSKSFKTIVLDARLDVVHKHALGSCKGTLHATPEGITYDTDNKDDKFSAALTAVETFEVDYVAKTMTIKIKKGKSYKFTDPEGNADRLFVFQRDVDKVRKRLAGG